ncbi:carbon-nitrogen hydrolase family protein [Lacimicrobium alkaliphilum]|uniref:Amidohydrolase n=1 Tax=Lacimicrobium alkaliphilum TaxID=1526571 RepID=A0A0U3AE58_9ALTE|nr:carbon-nitrogen hydrolase family protein [Lacimicrobium alkaliphilum]ALS96993.1 amidohydrolase [Lacimicrobium alkaliphilum]
MANLIALQMISTPDPQQNLQQVDKQLANLQVNEPTLVVLPECFACFGGSDKKQLELAEPPGQGPIQSALSDLARKYGIWLVAGTMPLQSQTDNNKFTASCLLFDPQGKQVAEYQKIHLFDVQVEDNTRSYKESATTQAGNKVVVVDSPFGRLGLAVCYDLRFPGLFQAMEQVDVLALPSAFTQVTGQAHWMPLLQARAIEKQCYLVAANQGGEHANGRQTYGHSVILSPWGKVLNMIRHGAGIVQASPDNEELQKIRRNMPVSQHNQFRSYSIESTG